MKLLLQETRRNPLLWLLVFVPIALAAEKLNHQVHTLHFVRWVLAILQLPVLLSRATESVGEDRRFGRWFAECHLWKSDEAGHRHRCVAGGTIHIGEGINRRRDRDEFVFKLGASFLIGGLSPSGVEPSFIQCLPQRFTFCRVQK